MHEQETYLKKVQEIEDIPDSKLKIDTQTIKKDNIQGMREEKDIDSPLQSILIDASTPKYNHEKLTSQDSILGKSGSEASFKKKIPLSHQKHKKSHSDSTGLLPCANSTEGNTHQVSQFVDEMISNVIAIYNSFASLIEIAGSIKKVPRLKAFPKCTPPHSKLKDLSLSLNTIRKNLFEPDRVRQIIDRLKKLEKSAEDGRVKMTKNIRQLEASILRAHSEIDSLLPTIDRCSNIQTEVSELASHALHIEEQVMKMVRAQTQSGHR